MRSLRDAVREGSISGFAAVLADGDATLALLRHELLCMALDATELSAEIDRDHLVLLARAGRRSRRGVLDERYFPRRPTLVPQLLKAIRGQDGDLRELISLILQDAALTADVLRRANSVHHRRSVVPVDTLGRALMLLGFDGLRALISVALMQPAFVQPRGCFDGFSDLAWTHALRTATAAQVYGRRSHRCDGFAAHFAGLLGSLGSIVLFRLMAEEYSRAPELKPQPEVFGRLLAEGSDRAALRIAEHWELEAGIVAALREQIDAVPPQEMSGLGRALYMGRLCATASLLVERGKLEAARARELLLARGLRESDLEVIETEIAAQNVRQARGG